MKVMKSERNASQREISGKDLIHELWDRASSKGVICINQGVFGSVSSCITRSDPSAAAALKLLERSKQEVGA